MIFLTKTDILEIHRRAIDEFGGAHGVLNAGALESALVSAENRQWYDAADLVGCAASYAFHLTRAHAFIDGNKRVAAAATEVFLLVNDAEFEASEDDLYEFFMGIASGEISRDATELWLRARILTKGRR
ncbi:MAG TPA: type II toxin-antitoxin system death-on-curing family toxin [Polyangia bacterium]|jgi:death-on-curing protein|nr:type II toxin-antitoxin system death-on-curing family toxin [Polyangia bacterium]